MKGNKQTHKLEHEQLEALTTLNIKKIKDFIRDSIDINKAFGPDKKRPIHFAVNERGNTELLDYLLQIPGIEIDALDANGNTALMYAANNGDSKICCFLIDHGADNQLRSRQNGRNTLELFADCPGYRSLLSSVKDAINWREASIKIEATKEHQITTTPHITSVTSRKQKSNYDVTTIKLQTFQELDKHSTGKTSWMSFWKCFPWKGKKQFSEENMKLLTPTTSTSKVILTK